LFKQDGFKGFTLLTIGQLISMIGSTMTQFGLGIWIWKITGNATPFSIIAVCFMVPNLLFSPLAGVFVDRWSKKKALILPDLSAGIITIITLILFLTSKLTLPFLYIAAFLSGVFNSLQWPAYSVTMSLMVKKDDLGKANGLYSICETAPALLSPIFAGMLLPLINLNGIFIIDIVTFLFAIFAVFIVIIPEYIHFDNSSESKNQNIIKDSLFGFSYIFQRRALLSVLTVFLLTNFFEGFSNTLFAPMILAKTNNNSVFLGIIQSCFGIGGVLGGLLMTFWGGTKKKIYSLLIGMMLTGFGSILLGLSKTLTYFIISVLLIAITMVITNASSQAIWQSNVPSNLQGRVFSARRFIAQFIGIIPMAVSGPLVDKILTPLFIKYSFLTNLFGNGKGGTISMLASVGGFFTIIVVIVGLLSPIVLNVENKHPLSN
jgi:MFS transporter, DHA3 family, macrolide efflux protein